MLDKLWSNDGRIGLSDSQIFVIFAWANQEVDLICDSPDSLCNLVIHSANLQCKSGKLDKYLLKMSKLAVDSISCRSANIRDSRMLTY